MTDLGLLVRRLVAGEHLLFYSEIAELMLPLPLYGASGSSRALANIVGMLAVTERRIFIVEKEGFLSLNREFDAIFSPEFARQLIKDVTAKNDVLKQQAMNMSIFSRNKWLKQNGYRGCVDILTGAGLDRSVSGYTKVIGRPTRIHYGKECLFLQLYHAYLDNEIREALENAKNGWMNREALDENLPGTSALLATLAASPVGGAVSRLVSSTHELRIKKSLIVAEGADKIDFDSDDNQLLMPIIQNYRLKTNIFYEPILDIMQAKTQEISEYIKEYENLSI